MATTIELRDQLTGPGGPFEVERAEVDGVEMLVYRERLPHLRAVAEIAASRGDDPAQPFLVHGEDLVEHEHVYIAQPPLFSTVVSKEKIYLKDEAAKSRFLADHPNHGKEFQRLKGLGEMDWEELGDTTMDAGRRTLLRVSVEQAAIADEVFAKLMGDDVESRKHFIQTNANDVRFLDI